MALSFQKLTAKISELKAEAEQARQAAVKDVVDKLVSAIDDYSLTSKDLVRFGGAKVRALLAGSSGGAREETASGGSTQTATSQPPKSVLYADGAGNTWSGRGPRPKWLRELVDAGRSLDEFRQPQVRANATPDATPNKSPTRKVAAKYRDPATGATWSGRGSMPRWLREATDGSTPIEDFLVGAPSRASKATPKAAKSAKKAPRKAS